MNRQEKIRFVENFAQRISESPLTFFVNFKGMNVRELTELRRQIRQQSGELKVVKNSLLCRIFADNRFEVIKDFLGSPNAVVLSSHDVVAIAKALFGFGRECSSLEIKGGIEGERKVEKEEIVQLSELPSKEILLGRLLGTLHAPASGLVSVLSGLQRNLVGLLTAWQRKKEQATA